MQIDVEHTVCNFLAEGIGINAINVQASNLFRTNQTCLPTHVKFFSSQMTWFGVTLELSYPYVLSLYFHHLLGCTCICGFGFLFLGTFCNVCSPSCMCIVDTRVVFLYAQ